MISDGSARNFDNFVVIDWSGANVARPKGLAIAYAERGRAAPSLLIPENGWTRQSILEWLLRHAEAGTNMLVGVDLSPALPFVDHDCYFPGWSESPKSALQLWSMVDQLAESDRHLAVSSFLNHPEVYRHFRHHNGCGDLFEGGSGRLRACERAQKVMGLVPSSCLNLVGAAQVGKSSLTGMRVLNRLRGKIPVWPFEPLGKSGPAIVEIYTSLAAREGGIPKGRSKVYDPLTLDRVLKEFDSTAHAKLDKYTDHATDAILTAAWLRKVAGEPARWSPKGLTRKIAATEGWTFGAF